MVVLRVVIRVVVRIHAVAAVVIGCTGHKVFLCYFSCDGRSARGGLHLPRSVRGHLSVQRIVDLGVPFFQ